MLIPFYRVLCVFGIFLAGIARTQQWDWATRFAGDGSVAQFLKSDDAGKLYIAGSFTGTNYFGSNQVASAGASDVFVAALDVEGRFLWAYTTGGTNEDRITGLAVSHGGGVYICGPFATNSAPGEASTNLLLARLDGGDVSWASRVGEARSGAMAIDHGGTIWIAAAEHGVVLARNYSPSGALAGTIQLGNGPFFPDTITVPNHNRILISGQVYDGSVDLRGQVAPDK